MNNEQSPIKVFVFIARDKAEYDKYMLENSNNDTQGDKSDAIDNGRWQWRFSSRSNILRAVVEKGRLGPSGWSSLQPRSNGERMADYLDALRMNPKDGNAINKVGTYVKKLFKIELIDIFLGELKGVDGVKILDKADVLYRIFIHWGGGHREQVLFYEREVQKWLEKKIRNARLYSLGTNRNDIFNVDRTTILIPSNAKELEALDDKFYKEQCFAGAMSDDPLSKVASCTIREADAKQKIEITMGGRNAALERIVDLQNRILTSSLDNKIKNELLTEIAAAKSVFKVSESVTDSNKSVEITVDEKTVRLARKILNKEVFNA